jgi:membrane-associated phospholipid phosphatase
MKRLSILLSVISLIAFFFFSKAVRSGVMKDIDFAATVKIQEKIDRSSRLRTTALIGNVFEGSTFLASPGFSVAMVLVLTVAASVDFRNKKIRLRGLSVPVLFALLVLAEIYGKTVVEHPAPPFSFIKNPHTIFPPEYINDQYSYPSGHAARALFLSMVFFAVSGFGHAATSKRLVIYTVLAGYVLLVSVSRIYLGHHWLSDIIGGILIGAGMASFFGVKSRSLTV